MSYLDDDDDVPFFFELEVDDEISFKAPQMATKKTVPVKRIETSRSSFAMPQFSVRNLVTSSELFKFTEAEHSFDKENNPKSNLSCNTAEKPKLPPSSAEKLMRYSVDSAVSFIENFSSMIPRDLPSFSTIAEGADESVEEPNAEDCDLSEAEISEYRCAGGLRGGKFTESEEFNFQLCSTNNKGDDNDIDIDGLASLIESASNDTSIDCRDDTSTKKNINENGNKVDHNDDDEEDICEDKSFKSESCESYDTASEDAAAVKQKLKNINKSVLPTIVNLSTQDQEKNCTGEEAVKGVNGKDDVRDVGGNKVKQAPTPTVKAAAIIPTTITTTATPLKNKHAVTDKEMHTIKDICAENIAVDKRTTTPAPLVPTASSPVSAAAAPSSILPVALLVPEPPVIASPGVPVPSRRMSMMKTLGERKNVPSEKEVEEVVKEDTNTSIEAQEVVNVVVREEKREGSGVAEVEVTAAAAAVTIEKNNKILTVKKDDAVEKEVRKVDDKVQVEVEVGLEIITDSKELIAEKMALSPTSKQNSGDEIYTKNIKNIENTDVAVHNSVSENAMVLSSKAVTFQDTPILIEGEAEGEGEEGKVNKCVFLLC